MLTEKKMVFVLDNKDSQLLEKIRFEAVSYIEDESEVPIVWKRNKTPIILESNLSKEFRENHECVYVPNIFTDSNDFIEFSHGLGVECGEFMSKEKYDTSKDACFLCDIASRGGYKTTMEFNAYTPNFHDIVIYETENFDVKVELGCINPGLLLISPKKHILSNAQIPVEQLEEYDNVKHDVEFLLKGALGDKPVIFFEHGSAPDGFSTHQRAIVHAHVHVAWGVKFTQKYLDMVCLKPTDIKELATKKYLSYQEGADGEFLAVSDPEVYVQRQYPRQVMGALLGIENEKTNWRNEAFEENFWITFDRWYAFLTENWDKLPERIKKATEAFCEGYALRIKP